jgi:predicted DNA-binding transcriptional regulator YafY
LVVFCRKETCNRNLPDGRLEVTFTTNGIEGIKHWIYRWLPHVVVVAPDNLRDTVTRELEAALGAHRRT